MGEWLPDYDEKFTKLDRWKKEVYVGQGERNIFDEITQEKVEWVEQKKISKTVTPIFDEHGYFSHYDINYEAYYPGYFRYYNYYYPRYYDYYYPLYDQFYYNEYDYYYGYDYIIEDGYTASLSIQWNRALFDVNDKTILTGFHAVPETLFDNGFPHGSTMDVFLTDGCIWVVDEDDPHVGGWFLNPQSKSPFATASFFDKENLQKIIADADVSFEGGQLFTDKISNFNLFNPEFASDEADWDPEFDDDEVF